MESLLTFCLWACYMQNPYEHQTAVKHPPLPRAITKKLWVSCSWLLFFPGPPFPSLACGPSCIDLCGLEGCMLLCSGPQYRFTVNNKLPTLYYKESPLTLDTVMKQCWVLHNKHTEFLYTGIIIFLLCEQAWRNTGVIIYCCGGSSKYMGTGSMCMMANL